jgi:hypothetical protein
MYKFLLLTLFIVSCGPQSDPFATMETLQNKEQKADNTESARIDAEIQLLNEKLEAKTLLVVWADQEIANALEHLTVAEDGKYIGYSSVPEAVAAIQYYYPEVKTSYQVYNNSGVIVFDSTKGVSAAIQAQADAIKKLMAMQSTILKAP